MASLASLPTELLISIVEHLDPPHDFATTADSPSPALKNLSLTSHRLHAICLPHLFRCLRLRLRHPYTLTTLTALRAFLTAHNLHPTHTAIDFGPLWNTGRLGLTLKKFLWELRLTSLTLYQSRHSPPSPREKSAKWPYALDTLTHLRTHTLDSPTEVKMLLLRATPVRVLHVDDGSFRAMYDDDDDDEGDAYFHRDPQQRPAVAWLKSGVVPRVETVVYTGVWPSFHRFDNFLGFVAGLSGVKRLEVTLMGGEDRELRLEKRGYRVSGDAVRYREVVAAYQILAGRVEGMKGLGCVVVGDVRVPWKGDTEPPRGFVEVGGGVWRREGFVGGCMK